MAKFTQKSDPAKSFGPFFHDFIRLFQSARQGAGGCVFQYVKVLFLIL